MQNTSFSVSSNPQDFSSGSFLDQLRCNAIIPSRPSISQLACCIDESEPELRSLDAVILSLRTTLVDLEETRKHYQRIYDQAKAFCAPIRRLPVEILGEIFSLCAESEEPVIFGERTQILSLSQVCHWWREITESSPRLWASVPWDINVANDETYPMVSHFLSKSQNVPLNLRFYLDKSPPEKILSALLGQSHRWQSVNLMLDDYLWEWVTEELRTRSRPVDGYFPNLQSLTIQNFGTHSKPLTRINMFEIAPNLSSFTIDILTDLFVIPFSQLKVLQVDYECANATATTLLHQCCNLEKLDLAIDEEFQDVHSSLPFPSYTELSTLVLNSCYPDVCSWVFRTLTFPASLTRLELSIYVVDDKPRSWPVEDFQSLISRSGCALEMLTINDPFLMTEDQLYETYRVLPTLTHLGFKAECSTALLNSLTINSNVQSKHQVFLPRLSYLVMYHMDLNADVADKFVDMVNSRKRLDIPGVACLRNVEFVHYSSERFSEVDLSSILNHVHPRLVSSGFRECEVPDSSPDYYILFSL